MSTVTTDQRLSRSGRAADGRLTDDDVFGRAVVKVRPMNRLATETSPYLRQHRDNPVDWYAWGPDAFAAAQQSDRPILLSVGYSACHWCHVMAHECFENDEVAGLMNELFVNVKVDREERPDVDAIYMDAVQAMTGRGGWPMTVFMTPTGDPFYGGTYFPRERFVQLLRGVGDVWRHRRGELDQNITALRASLDRASQFEAAANLPGVTELAGAFGELTKQFDQQWGGFGAAPKFPSSMNLDLLLRGYDASKSPVAAHIVTTTLDAMASGGIYDHLGGGFARYSTDDRWLVPHFEKMLYDQALIVRTYLRAWQVTGNERWRQVVAESIDYVLTELTHSGGGFFSAEDADSLDAHGHTHEGAFYVWTPQQIRDAVGAELAAAAIEWWEVTDEGNFEGATILSRLNHRGDLIRPAQVDEARRILHAERAKRPRPGLDDKVLAEWNGLMLATLAEAAAAMQHPDWLAAAIANGEFLLASLRSPTGRWYRSWQADGGARHDALAADHAALIDGFTRLAEASGQARWIDAARETADALLDRFWDVDHGGVFTVADDGEQLIVRQKDVTDTATPSANSLAANALIRLAALTGEARYANQAEQILLLVGGLVGRAPTAFGHMFAAIDMRRAGITEIVITGDRPDLVAAAQTRYLPNAVLAWGEPYDSPLWTGRSDGRAYVCEHYACQAPVETADDLAELLTQPFVQSPG